MLQVFINGNRIVILVKVVTHTEADLLYQVIHIQHLHTGSIEDLFTSSYYFFGTVIINKFKYCR